MSKVTIEDVLNAAREIDMLVGGKELAQMPVSVAKIIVRLQCKIQDYDNQE